MNAEEAKKKVKEDLEKEMGELVTKLGQIELQKIELDTMKSQVVGKMNDVYKQLGELNEKTKASTV